MRLSILIIVFLCLFSCKPSAPPPSTKAKCPLVVIIPGLGLSQMESLAGHVASDFPSLQLANFRHNGYRANVYAYVSASRFDRLVLIGHSFGADTACTTCLAISSIDLLILIDPVSSEAFRSHMIVPPNVRRCLVFRRKDGGAAEAVRITARADVLGVHELRVVDASHNGLPDDPAVTKAVHDEIAAVIGGA